MGVVVELEMYSNILFLFLSILIIQCKGQKENEGNESPLVNAKIYSSIFVRRREEQKTLLDHFQRTEKYDRKYKLLEIGLNQILSVLRENRDKLLKENYSTSNGFPKQTNLIDAWSLIVENICLMGDLVLHMPDMSEKILSKDKNWKEIVDWAIQFTSNLRDVIDTKSLKMLSLFDQEINVEKRTNDYINPYREVEQTSVTNKRTKQPKKKLKRGPQLHSGSRTEL